MEKQHWRKWVSQLGTYQAAKVTVIVMDTWITMNKIWSSCQSSEHFDRQNGRRVTLDYC